MNGQISFRGMPSMNGRSKKLKNIGEIISILQLNIRKKVLEKSMNCRLSKKGIIRKNNAITESGNQN